MNKVYKVIWNAQLGCWQAVSELAKSHTGSQSATSENNNILKIGQKVSKLIMVGLAILPLSIHAAISNTELPTGAQINSGAANISQTGNTLNINQNSQNLSTNWNTFNIGQDATVNFNQQNQSSVAINHVKDSNASQIMGRLNANGQVFLLNPNGVVFSKTAQVNVGGMVASTLSLSDKDIQNGKYTLKGDANSTATIENYGTINTLLGGTVALIAPNVKNTGTIKTPNGTTHLTSASQVTLALQDGSLTQYQVDQGVLKGLVDNGGAIIADNGAVYLTAKAKDSLSKAVVNHSGIIEANRLTQNAKGEIILLGDMQNGETNVSGTLKAEGKNGADGGFIETSAAKVNIADGTKVSTLSDRGKTGEWLIDPYNVVISNATGTGSGFVANQDDTVINATTLTNALATTGVTVSTGGTAVGTQEGNITVDADLAWTSNSTLTLQADNDIILNKQITATNGGLTLNAVNNISANDAVNVGTFTLAQGNWLQNAPLLPSFYAKDFRLNGGSFIRALGGDGSATTPWKLTDIYGIQGMGTKLSGNFALENDIDASGTVNWNNGAGFNPIGNGGYGITTKAFIGKFDGMNFKILKLFINRPANDSIGLFGYINNASIKNIGVLDVDVNGHWNVGALVGYADSSTISETYSTGVVHSNYQAVGGLVGFNNLSSVIKNSYSSAIVTVDGASATGSFAGGLVGANEGNAIIENSYATGNVTGKKYVGGLTGDNQSQSVIKNSYATGLVSGSSSVGGLVGLSNSTIQDSFWNTETTGQSTSAGGTGLTTAQMFDKNYFTGFDFSTVWGNGNNQTTPYLLNMANNQVFNKNDLPTGTISSTNRPALYTAILNVNQLQNMNQNLSGKYLLGNNIDASDTVNWNSGAGFNPIGDSTSQFTGMLDGLGHSISTLVINNPLTNYVGLFGYLSNTAKVINTALLNQHITGNGFVGGFSGYNSGLLDNVYTTGSVSSISSITGGIVGENHGVISKAYVTGNTTSIDYSSFAGGLVGRNYGNIINSYVTGGLYSGSHGGNLVGENYAKISDSYTTGNVAASIAGGLVGKNTGEIKNAYATGFVTGWSTSGGLIGSNSGTINNSFWNIETSGKNTSSGDGTGLTTAQIQNLSTFTDAGWDVSGIGGENTVWRIYEGQTAPLLRNFLTALTITNGNTTTTYNGKNQGGGYQVVPVGTIYDPTLILSQQKNATPTAVNINLNKDLYSVQQGYDLIVEAGSGTGTLKINPKDITVTATGGSSTYGDNPLNPNFSANGLVNGEAESVLTGLNNSFGINNTSNADTYTLTVDGTLTNGNYNITQRNDGTWVVGKKDITVTATGGSSTYGDNPLNPNFSANGLVNGEAESVLTGLNNSFGINNTSNADTYTLTVDGTLTNGNYNITQRNDGTWVVGKKDITVTATGGSSTYGDNPLNPNFSANGLVNGEAESVLTGLNNSFGINNTSNADTYTLTVDGTLTNGNYNITKRNDGSWVVGKKDITVTATGGSSTYGDNPLNPNFSANGLVNGEAESVLTGLNNSFGINNTSNADTYTLTVDGTLTNGNYNITQRNDGSWVVGKKDITVTATGGSSTYGDNPLNPNFSANGLVNGEAESVLTGLNNSFGINNTSNADTYTLTVDGTLTNGNYNITKRNDGSWVVGKKDITVTATGGSSTYGDNPLNPNFSANGLVNGEAESVLTGLNNSFGINNTSNADTYTLTVDGTLTNGNYNITKRNDGSWVVGKKDITVTATGGSSTYGDNPLNPNFSANGLVNGEAESVLTGLNNSFGINNTSNADTYTLTVDGTLTNGNYNITQRNDGTWVVGKKDITVTATGGSSTYGDNPLNPNFSANGLVNGEAESVLTGLNNSFGINNTSNADTYTLTVDGTLTNGNYNITQRNDGTWVVKKAKAIVMANSLNTIYNGKDQTASGFTAQGLVNGETESVLTGVTASITGKDAGSYANKASGVDKNYDLSFVNGSLDIEKAKATVTANSVNTTYNGKDQTASGFTATGLVNGETESVLTGVTASITAKNAGKYTNKATGIDQNYDLTFVDGGFDIAKAKATVTANSVNTTYNGKDQTVSGFTAQGLVNGETESVLTGVTASITAKNAGKYTNKATGIDQNYDLTFVDGGLDIAKAKINQVTGITANDRIYDATRDATLNTGSAQFEGIVTGDQLTVATATGQFNDKNVGTAKNVAINNISLSGTDSHNYELVKNTAQTTADISKANISAITGITANSRVYDGLTDASLNTANSQFNGLYAGDQLTVATATGQFESASTGQNKTVSITGLSLAGTDAQNYNLVDHTASTQANIYMLTPANYLQAIQFKRPSYLPESDKGMHAVNIEVRQGGVNTTGLQTLAGEH